MWLYSTRRRPVWYQWFLYMSLRALKVWVERLGFMESMFRDIELKKVDRFLFCFYCSWSNLNLWLGLLWWLQHNQSQKLIYLQFCSGCWAKDTGVAIYLRKEVVRNHRSPTLFFNVLQADWKDPLTVWTLNMFIAISKVFDYSSGSVGRMLPFMAEELYFFCALCWAI